MITEDYCSYEVAKILKDKGFNELCYCHEFTDYEGNFTTYHTEYPENWNQSEPCVSIPTLGMAMAWLREVHNIHISVYVFNRELPITDVPISYTCDIATKKLSSQQGHLRGVWQSYEQAVEAALKYSLENLI